MWAGLHTEATFLSPLNTEDRYNSHVILDLVKTGLDEEQKHRGKNPDLSISTAV